MRSAFTKVFLSFLLLDLLYCCEATQFNQVQAQAGRVPPASEQKKNKRPADNKEANKEEQLPPDLANDPKKPEKLLISTNIVNVDVVVYQKKGGKIITGLKKENFAVFEDGVKQEISNFATPAAPITVAMVLEYSKLTDRLGGSFFEPGRYEV
ncbi:MAG: hypothetical protein ACRD4L_00735, partial [Pyrinomonadaceae bacterium]